MKKSTVVLAAAALFVAGNVAVISSANAATVKCVGANACKGMSSCKSATNACKGMNSCKGMGFTEAADEAACTKAGGKVTIK